MTTKIVCKVYVVLILVVVAVIGLIGCLSVAGNKSIGPDLTQTFQWAIIQLGNGELIEGTVTTWHDFKNSDVVQVTIDKITYLTHYSNVILTTECP